MFIRIIKQYLSNIWSLIKHEGFNQQWDWVEKTHCLLKSIYIYISYHIYIYYIYYIILYNIHYILYIIILYVLYVYYICIYIYIHICTRYTYYIHIICLYYLHIPGIIQELNLAVLCEHYLVMRTLQPSVL